MLGKDADGKIDKNVASSIAATFEDSLRKSQWYEDVSGKRITQWIWPKGLEGPVNNANAEALRAWIDKDKDIKGLPIANFIHSKQLAEVRRRAIEELNIPEIREMEKRFAPIPVEESGEERVPTPEEEAEEAPEEATKEDGNG